MLAKLRYPARYAKDEFTLVENEGNILLDSVKSMLRETSSITKANLAME